MSRPEHKYDLWWRHGRNPGPPDANLMDSFRARWFKGRRARRLRVRRTDESPLPLLIASVADS